MDARYTCRERRCDLASWMLAPFLAWALVLIPAFASSQIRSDGILLGEAKRDTLRDLAGFEVVVEALQQEGVSTPELQAEIESQLEQAGIQVFRAGERLRQPGYPYLYVRLSVVPTERVHSYALEVSVNQTVSLTRSPTISTFAPTWSVTAVGVMDPFSTAALHQTVKDYVQRFIDAYHGANRLEAITIH